MVSPFADWTAEDVAAHNARVKRAAARLPSLPSPDEAIALKGKGAKTAGASDRNLQAYAITPMGKPRMTQRDKWKKRPATDAYHDFCDTVRRLGINLPLSGAHVTFILPMPKSWPEKKKLNLVGKAHQLKPDVDNCLKALMDAVFDDDSKVWDVRITKLWGREGRIIISR